MIQIVLSVKVWAFGLQYDIAYISTQEGWLYLAVLIVRCSRKDVGRGTSSRMTAKIVCDTLQMAIWQRKPKTGLIRHSDPGSEYVSHAFRQLFENQVIKGRMSRKGGCWGNSVVERFFEARNKIACNGETIRLGRKPRWRS